MYPTLVMVLVETRCSMTDMWEISPSNVSQIAGPVASEDCPAILGHLFFTASQIHSTMDSEVESQPLWALRAQDGQEHESENVIVEVKESQLQVGASS